MSDSNTLLLVTEQGSWQGAKEFVSKAENCALPHDDADAVPEGQRDDIDAGVVDDEVVEHANRVRELVLVVAWLVRSALQVSIQCGKIQTKHVRVKTGTTGINNPILTRDRSTLRAPAMGITFMRVLSTTMAPPGTIRFSSISCTASVMSNQQLQYSDSQPNCSTQLSHKPMCLLLGMPVFKHS